MSIRSIIWNSLLLLAVFLTHCEKEPHPDDPVSIPDTAFHAALIEEGVDLNGDSIITYREAGMVSDLD